MIRFINLEIEINRKSASAYYAMGGVQAGADLVSDGIENFPGVWKMHQSLSLLEGDAVSGIQSNAIR